MEIKDIKECAEYLKDKVGIIIILLSGIILCGTTSICIFNKFNLINLILNYFWNLVLKKYYYYHA